MSDARVPAVLDHVAVAVERHADAWPRYAGELAGAWVSDGPAPGFHAAQLRYRNGMKIELLAPHQVEENDFLRRFLDRSGPGPHHLTFKVPDIVDALGAVEEAGYRPVGVDLSDDDWKEAFLHPKDGPGIVVQLAQSAGDWWSDRPEDVPPPRTEQPADLVHVAHAVADLRAGLALFVDLLGGTAVEEGESALGRHVDVTWPGPGHVRLVDASPGAPSAHWVGDRPGRLHHLLLRTERPGDLAGARTDPSGTAAVEVPPESNLGVRLLVDPA